MNRKFQHKVIDITIKITLISCVLYGVIGGIYFAATKGIVDFGFYM
jgi:uncharacterized protein YneF (UPF0154 family)